MATIEVVKETSQMSLVSFRHLASPCPFFRIFEETANSVRAARLLQGRPVDGYACATQFSSQRELPCTRWVKHNVN